MQTQISTTESSQLSPSLLFESNPPGDKIDPPDNTSPEPEDEEEETPPEGQ